MSGPWQKYSPNPSPAPVTVEDIQRRLGRAPTNFSTDIGTRARGDVASLQAALANVRANPGNLLNAPKALAAVAQYAQNAFGLAPAAALDQATRPVVQRLNSTFGQHLDPHDATDLLLGMAGLIPGIGEAGPALSESERLLQGAEPIEAGEAAASAEHPAPAPTPRVIQPIARPPSPKQAAAKLRAMPDSVIAAPDDEFAAWDQHQNEVMDSLPEDVQRHFFTNAKDMLSDPIFDDPDFEGYTGQHVADFRSALSDLASHYRPQGQNGQILADQIDALNQQFTAMATRQQPRFAKAIYGADHAAPSAGTTMGTDGGIVPVRVPAAAGDSAAETSNVTSLAPYLPRLTSSELEGRAAPSATGQSPQNATGAPSPIADLTSLIDSRRADPNATMRGPDPGTEGANTYTLKLWPKGATPEPTQAEVVQGPWPDAPRSVPAAETNTLVAPAGSPLALLEADGNHGVPSEPEAGSLADVARVLASLSPDEKEQFGRAARTLIPQTAPDVLPPTVTSLAQSRAARLATPATADLPDGGAPNAFSNTPTKPPASVTTLFPFKGNALLPVALGFGALASQSGQRSSGPST